MMKETESNGKGRQCL